MANSNGWGDGAANNAIGWGQGANNAIGWGDIHADSWAGLTDIVGTQTAALLLDTYPSAAVAYSLRKLRTDYSGSSIRVRRSSDNAEQNIGFVGNDLDTASLLTFCGVGNGFITTWYDQSTNANNSTQATAATQAQIVASGALVTDPITNKISTLWNSDAYFLGTSLPTPQLNYQLAVFNRTADAQRIISLGNNTTSAYLGQWSTTNNLATFYGNTTITHLISADTGCFIQTILRDGSNVVKCWNNQTALTTGTDTATYRTFNFWGKYTTPQSSGYKQELIYWTSDQESNRIGIETNANTYWDAY